MNKFCVTFEDGTNFTGNPFSNDWNKFPDKAIIQFDYIFGAKHVRLCGYKEYNHLLENYSIGKTQSNIKKIFLMGRKETETDILIFDLVEKKLIKRTVALGYEYNNQILTGWKKGILKEPQIYVNK